MFSLFLFLMGLIDETKASLLFFLRSTIFDPPKRGEDKTILKDESFITTHPLVQLYLFHDTLFILKHFY